MPRKLRELIKDLEQAGWVRDHFTGRHRVFKHPNVSRHASLAGKNPSFAVSTLQKL